MASDGLKIRWRDDEWHIHRNAGMEENALSHGKCASIKSPKSSRESFKCGDELFLSSILSLIDGALIQ